MTQSDPDRSCVACERAIDNRIPGRALKGMISCSVWLKARQSGTGLCELATVIVGMIQEVTWGVNVPHNKVP